jgi:RNA polymerase sigma-70 factor, ECF subfamily
MPSSSTDSAPGSSRGASDDRERVERAVRDLQAGTGLPRSFDLLFHRFSTPLHRQFLRWGASPEEARDLNQETFQRIFQDAGSFRGSDDRLFESWIGWIWKIAHTTWLRSRRWQRAEKRPQNPQSLDAVDEREPLAAGPPRQLERLLRKEVGLKLRRAIEELPEQELKCVILYYYRELKTKQVAVILGIAQGTVKAHLSHARAKLEEKLGGHVDFGERRASA